MSEKKNPELDAKHQAILRRMMYVALFFSSPTPPKRYLIAFLEWLYGLCSVMASSKTND